MHALNEEKKQQRKQADTERKKFRGTFRITQKCPRAIRMAINTSRRRYTGQMQESALSKYVLLMQFGVPLSQACHPDDREHTYDKVEQVVTSTERISTQLVDWNHLDIDLDREIYFKGLYNRYESSQRGLGINIAAVETPSEQNTSLKSSRVGAKKQYEYLTSSKNLVGTDPDYLNTYKVILTPKQIEEELGIQKQDQTSATAERFFMTRHDFYEQQQRLSNLLTEELSRLDYQRWNSIQRKSKFFELQNVVYLM